MLVFRGCKKKNRSNNSSYLELWHCHYCLTMFDHLMDITSGWCQHLTSQDLWICVSPVFSALGHRNPIHHVPAEGHQHLTDDLSIATGSLDRIWYSRDQGTLRHENISLCVLTCPSTSPHCNPRSMMLWQYPLWSSKCLPAVAFSQASSVNLPVVNKQDKIRLNPVSRGVTKIEKITTPLRRTHRFRRYCI